jgi:hypothetical protein
MEYIMADRDFNNPDDGRRGAGDRSEQKRSRGKGGNNEWMQDQTGEDHNLSGSDTYRTLPDQPADDADDQGARDASKRQSNR